MKYASYFLENHLLKSCKYIAGIDEVGRGPLAGPLVVAITLYNRDHTPIAGIADSKKLTFSKRNTLAKQIRESVIDYKYSVINNQMIDKLGIYNCLYHGIISCYYQLKILPAIVLIDGKIKYRLPFRNIQRTKGDLYHYSIACSSIIAKDLRDQMMIRYSKMFPSYGFETNMGYGTSKHINAIKENGTTNLHRLYFCRNL